MDVAASPKVTIIPRDEGAIARERRYWWTQGEFSRFFVAMMSSEHAEANYWSYRRAHKESSIEEDNYS